MIAVAKEVMGLIVLKSDVFMLMGVLMSWCDAPILDLLDGLAIGPME